MTEAGRKWILDKTPEQPKEHFEAVEYWLRAFCKEVDKLMFAWASDDYAYQEVRSQLLEDE